MAKRVKFTIEWEVDLDMMAGFGNQPESWAEYLVAPSGDLLRQTHYNPSVKIVKTEVTNRKFG